MENPLIRQNFNNLPPLWTGTNLAIVSRTGPFSHHHPHWPAEPV